MTMAARGGASSATRASNQAASIQRDSPRASRRRQRPRAGRTHAAHHQRGRPAPGERQQPQAQADRQLSQRQQRGKGQVVIELERLVDRHLEGGAARPAAQGHDDGEAGEAEREDQRRQPRQQRCQARPLQGAPDRASRESQLGGQPPVGRRRRLQRLQHQSCGERQVVEHMGQHDAREAVEIARLETEQPLPQRRRPAAPAMHRHQAEQADQGGQHQRELHGAQQQGPAGEGGSPRQGHGHGHGEPHAEQRGERGLPQGEAQDGGEPWLLPEHGRVHLAGLPQQRPQAAEPEARHQRQGGEPQPRRPGRGARPARRRQRAAAFSHSRIQARRLSRTSSGVNVRLSGSINRSNTAGSSSPRSMAGFITLPSGI